MTAIFIGGALIAGLLIGLAVAAVLNKQKKSNARREAEKILNQAKRGAEKMEREAYIKAREKLQKERVKFQNQMKQREAELHRAEDGVRKKEKDIRRLENKFQEKEWQIKKQQRELAAAQEEVELDRQRVKELLDEGAKRLEGISGLDRAEAKKELTEILLNEAKSEATQQILDIKQEAAERGRWEATEIMAFAIEKMATEYTMESTLISVSLPNDNWKGLIIGREGRNIKAFEAATGVKVIVDDTPETVVMSSFDPIKREVARLAMESLIKNKNISPKAIEAEVAKAEKAVDKSIRKAADETLNELKIQNVHPEMREALGRLKYRTSYGQNILAHSREVAWLAGNMAAELGLDVNLARRAGLFHDIGKAVSNDSEGSHVSLGVELTTHCKEHEVVVNAVLAHHEEAEPISPVSVLVTAADRISGARPGARRESLEAYTQRITKLEELAKSFQGVAKTYALSAGREIRVIVVPEKLTDMEAKMLASDIAKKIKESMEYPGRIKVTVIRRLKSQSSTQEFTSRNGKKASAV